MFRRHAADKVRYDAAAATFAACFRTADATPLPLLFRYAATFTPY